MNRIDVHQHVVPPFWVAGLQQKNRDASGFRPPAWSPEAAIAFMDSQQISTGILSLTSPGVIGWSRSERRAAARRVNDYTSDLVAKRPDRFGNFATLPLPGIDESDPVACRRISSLCGISFRIGHRRLYPECAERSSATGHLSEILFRYRTFLQPYGAPQPDETRDPKRILFGTDFRYAPGGLAETFTAMLDENETLSQAQHAAINRGNGVPLFPRLGN